MNSNKDADFKLNENLTFVTLLQALKMQITYLTLSF